MNKEICVITTGGTIDKVYFDKKSSFEVGDSTIDSVLTQANVQLGYRVVSLLKKDSLDLTDADRKLIFETAMAQPEKAILITHGTDTMPESAKLFIKQTDKTVVFTGAMQPARFSSTDAIFNIGFSVAAATTLPPGGYIAINGLLFDPSRAEKNRAGDCFVEN